MIKADVRHLSERDRERYCNDFVDPIIAPKAKRWKVTPSGSGYQVATPAKTVFYIEDSQVSWGDLPKEQVQSARLWLFSLGFLPVLIGDYEDWETTERLVESFVQFSDSHEGRSVFSTMSSLDHCLAARIRTSCFLLALGADDRPDLKERLLGLITADADSALHPGFIQANNHGMMLATSLLHARIFCAGSPTSEEWEDIGESAVRSILTQAIDEDGYCNENTPGYHLFYVNFVKQIQEFVEFGYEASSFSAFLEDLRERATVGLQRLIWPGGEIPPIGDSGVSPSGLRSINGEFFSRKHGFFIKKTDSLYLSVTCGMSSIVHKHVDDTSITLRSFGKDLLIDSGFNNYDWHNPLTVSVKSQRGHSGLFFANFDHLYPGSVFRADLVRMKGEINEIETQAGVRAFDCSYVFDELYKAHRRVFIEGSNRVVLEDSFMGPEDAKPCQRFIFPAEAKVELERGSVLVSNGTVRMRISFSARCAVNSSFGTLGDFPKGFRSVKFGHTEPAYCFEVHPSPEQTSMRSTIVYWNSSLSDEPCFESEE